MRGSDGRSITSIGGCEADDVDKKRKLPEVPIAEEQSEGGGDEHTVQNVDKDSVSKKRRKLDAHELRSKLEEVRSKIKAHQGENNSSTDGSGPGKI